MIVAFANNQVILCEGGGATVEVTTDPVPMGENNRGAAILTVHYIFGATSPTLAYVTQVSNDGTTWVAQGPDDAGINAAGTRPIVVDSINGAFTRVKYTFSASGSGTAAVCFDLHVNLDKE